MRNDRGYHNKGSFPFAHFFCAPIVEGCGDINAINYQGQAWNFIEYEDPDFFNVGNDELCEYPDNISLFLFLQSMF